MSAINWWPPPVDAPLHIHDRRRSAAFVTRHRRAVSATHSTERVTNMDESNFAAGVAARPAFRTPPGTPPIKTPTNCGGSWTRL